MHSSIPSWLDSDLVAKLNLKSRCENPLLEIPWNSHRTHPKAYGSLFLPQWTSLFQQENPGVTRQPVDVRYPFLDLRMVNYLLAIPTMPWFFRKYILREAMRRRLPEEIRMRPKRPMEVDPIFAALRDFGTRGIEQIQPAKELYRLGTLPPLAPVLESQSSEQILMRLRPLLLSYWLKSFGRNGYRMPLGAAHAEARGVAS